MSMEIERLAQSKIGVWERPGVESLHVAVLCTCLEAIRDREACLPFQVIVCFPVILLIG